MYKNYQKRPLTSHTYKISYRSKKKSSDTIKFVAERNDLLKLSFKISIKNKNYLYQ